MMETLKVIVDMICQRQNCEPENYQIIILCIGIVSFLSMLVTFPIKLINNYFKVVNTKKLHLSTLNYYSNNDIDRYTKNYIEQYYQNINPSDYDFDSNQLVVAKEKIQKYFLKEILVTNNKDKYILILADTGMGKTAFLINLYLKYLKKQIFRLGNTVYTIKLIPLGHKNALKEISEIKNKNRCFLMLDALDEDIEATQNFSYRFNELMNIIEEFKLVIITARTQFFAKSIEEPYATNDYSMGDSGEYKFKKIFISPFDEKDCRKYIEKSFSCYEFNNKAKAIKLVKSIKAISFRPMIMTFIRELIFVKTEFRYDYEIFEHLIINWLKRESKKAGIAKKYGGEKEYQDLLFQLSIKIAYKLYLNRTEKGGLYFNVNEKIEVGNLSASDLLSIDSSNDADKDREIRSKSLLTRNSIGECRFAHKSFLEFFLAKYLIEHPIKIDSFNFSGFDQLKRFLKDMILNRYSDNIFFSNFESTNDILNLILGSDINPYLLIPLINENGKTKKMCIHFSYEAYPMAFTLVMIMKDHKLRNELFEYLADSKSGVEKETTGRMNYIITSELLNSYIKLDPLIGLSISDGIPNNDVISDLKAILRRFFYMQNPKHSIIYPPSLYAHWMKEINEKESSDLLVYNQLYTFIKHLNELEIISNRCKVEIKIVKPAPKTILPKQFYY